MNTTPSLIPGKYAVVGHPIAHSRSPEIHCQFAAQFDRHIDYQAVELALSDFPAQIQQLREQDYRGLNVTVPFKNHAYELADTLTPEAQSAGAVNTLQLTESGIVGHNSDGIGLVTALKYHDFSLTGKRLLILGAGGAVAGILKPLMAEQPTSITIANRTLSKADQLATDFSHPTISVAACTYDTISNPEFDGIIQATSLGLQGEYPAIAADVIAQADWGYDLMYAAEPTAFLQFCRDAGLSCLADGWSMLVAQAAESYRFWHGQQPNLSALLQR